MQRLSRISAFGKNLRVRVRDYFGSSRGQNEEVICVPQKGLYELYEHQRFWQEDTPVPMWKRTMKMAVTYRILWMWCIYGYIDGMYFICSHITDIPEF